MAIRFARHVHAFAETLERSGATVIISSSLDHRPARLRVSTPDAVRVCDVYLWAIRVDGPVPPRPAGTFKVQFTNPEGYPLTGFPLLPGIPAIVGGWSEEHGVYAFWDARRHVHFSENSPNCQVKGRTLDVAHHKGIATQLRATQEGEEVVVAVDPDSLLWYVMEGEGLHNGGDVALAVEDLVTANPEVEREFLDADPSEAGSARRYDLVQIMRAYRDAKFKPKVLRAYANRCAVCQTDLKLVDAAHIVPVAYQGSTDEVNNGLALCKLHHAAYDNALLGVKSDHSIITNPAMLARLRKLGLALGWDEFNDRLPPSITLPSHPENNPLRQHLITGLRARKWADNLIG